MGGDNTQEQIRGAALAALMTSAVANRNRRGHVQRGVIPRLKLAWGTVSGGDRRRVAGVGGRGGSVLRPTSEHAMNRVERGNWCSRPNREKNQQDRKRI